MKPIAGRVMVRHVLKPSTAGGRGLVHIPEQYRGTTNEGIVLALSEHTGERAEDGSWIPMTELQVGDRVLFRKRAGTVVQVGDARVRLMHYGEIVAKIDVGHATVCPECLGTGVTTVEDHGVDFDVADVPRKAFRPQHGKEQD